LYGSHEWLERGADLALFKTSEEDGYETADFPLSELDLQAPTLAALSGAGYDTFLQVIDLDRRDFLGIEGLGEQDADRLLQLIDELTVIEGETVADDDAGNGEESGVEAEVAGEDKVAAGAAVDAADAGVSEDDAADAEVSKEVPLEGEGEA
jgi:hypothetical protein